MIRSLVLITILFALLSFSGPDDLLNEKMPVISWLTLNGKLIDSSYFKNKITLLNFMYIGCPSCMAEINELKKLNKFYANTDFQILCIAPHTAEQLRAFNSDQKSVYNGIRNYFKADSIEYEILPECKNVKRGKRTTKTGDTIIGPECDKISKPFKVDAYPQSFLIDRKGIVRKSYLGFTMEQSDADSISKYIRTDIDILLK